MENIFTSLDVEALLAAERVSADWRRIIDDGHVWRKFFHIKVKQLESVPSKVFRRSK